MSGFWGQNLLSAESRKSPSLVINVPRPHLVSFKDAIFSRIVRLGVLIFSSFVTDEPQLRLSPIGDSRNLRLVCLAEYQNFRWKSTCQRFLANHLRGAIVSIMQNARQYFAAQRP